MYLERLKEILTKKPRKFFFLLTTTNCDLQCKYCYEKSFYEPDFEDALEEVPSFPTYKMEELENFLENWAKKENIGIILYGGEPLLNESFVRHVAKLPYYKGIQTNGTHLQNVRDVLNDFDFVFISLDGGREITTYYRGFFPDLSVFKSYKGELVARMTLEERSRLYRDVLDLYDLGFKSIHWQLDANFWHDWERRNFPLWAKQYMADLVLLLEWWILKLKIEEPILLYPFAGILKALLYMELIGEKNFY